MSLRGFTKFALLALCVTLPASAQTAAHITVSKNPDDFAPHTTIQAAINAAAPGQIIEILDTATYREQVTIDSTKHGITLRSSNPTSLAKPKIVWQDTENQYPQNSEQAKTPGDGPRTSGNFETCGALRIKRAQGVTIDGITVDGGGAAPFAFPNVWNGMDALAHGNAAITLVVAGGAVIRNCELRNAYIGLNVKDRNTGGVFGNPNPADNDKTIPLSGFGKVGNHLIEYNRIHDNSLGIFFESAWDLASTVRYNLIYNNYHVTSVLNWIKSVEGTLGSENNNLPACGAIMFKDMVYTPVAIYNNTFYNNKLNLIGHWKIAAPHLLFNNIFGKSMVPVVTPPGNQQEGFKTGNIDVSFMEMDTRFAARMHNSIFSAYTVISTQGRAIHLGQQCNDQQYDTLWVDRVAIWNFDSFGASAGTASFTMPNCPAAPVSMDGVVSSGALIDSYGTDVSWLETTGLTLTNGSSGKTLRLDTLFQSVDPTNARFLWPKWDHPLVQKFIQNKGWAAAGIRNADGKIADLGAISSNNDVHQPTLARIRPTGVVLITGTNARANFTLSLESGTMTNPKIKLLRWVSPLPVAGNFGGSAAPMVAPTAIRNITPPSTAIKFGPNTLDIPLASATTAEYGFFEVIIEGTGPNGEVVSDIGFLPYRQLDYILDIKVSGANVTPGTIPQVTAGTPVTLTVTAMKRGVPANQPYTTGAPNTPLQVDYSLLSDPTAKMYRGIDPLSGALTYDANLATPPAAQYTKNYTVYFTKAGDETVSGAGLWCEGGNCDSTNNRIVFLGTLDIKVKPGVPDKVVFLQPIPKSQIPAGVNPPTISGMYDVEVQVQDKFGNAVDVAVPVSMVSSDTGIGDIGAPKTASTGVADGIARFSARVTNGKQGDIFDMYASITISQPTADSKTRDTASLRVGRPAHALWVFYYQSTPPKHGKNWIDDFEEEERIDALVGTVVPVWVKVVDMTTTGDTVITSRDAFICVSSADGLLFSADSGTAATAGPLVFPMKGGVAKFWVTSIDTVAGASISVSARTASDCGSLKDNGINDGSRGAITFDMPRSGIGTAFVKGDGYGRPNYVEITFTGEGGVSAALGTDSVKLSWPGACAGVVPVKSTDIKVLPDNVTIGVTFDPTAFPEGYSAPLGSSGDLVTVYSANAPVGGPTVLIDSIGPLIGRVRPARCDAESFDSPTFDENTSPGVTPYLLRLRVTESLSDYRLLVGKSILMSSDESGTGQIPLTVESVGLTDGIYTLTLSPSDILRDGFWIKFNPDHSGILDNAGNAAAPDNRRVQISQKESPAGITKAWYTTADNTGMIDAVYVTFNKGLTEADIEAWFSGGSFSFPWAGVGGFSVNAGNIGSISVVSPGTNTIRIDMAAALTEVEYNKMTGGKIRTSGDIINFTVNFNPGKGWEEAKGTAVDNARPVLVSAVLQIGSVSDKGDEPDTLILTFSEDLMEDILLSPITNPVSILGGSSWNPVSVRYINRLKPVGDVVNVVRYEVIDIKRPDGSDPKSGDLVKINELAGVADRATPPNVQDKADNHPVPLEIRPGKPNWKTKVKNNPFRDSVVVETTPNAKGDVLSVKAYIKLYDNMGKLVVSDTLKNDPDRGGNAVAWVWKGRNKAGRAVGTGTYLFKAVYTVEGSTGIDPYQETKSIGYVRGKN